MPFKIVRHDITKMTTEAIVNTANEQPEVGTGCDHAVYMAAGYDELLAYRKAHIGFMKEGDAFLTPGFRLSAKYIIHTVSPLYIDGKHGEEQRLRSCYRNSLALAAKNKIQSIAFPLISTGGFGYPKEEGMRIAVDEIHAFLLHSDMLIFLVVFDEKATRMGKSISPDLESYIDLKYVQQKREEEYDTANSLARDLFCAAPMPTEARKSKSAVELTGELDIEVLEHMLEERMAHMSDTFSQYLFYLIDKKGMENADVYKRAIVDKKVFSKIKNNPDYHPQKRTALCLCIGARLNLDETRDLLARAGYALSPCDKMDIIFSYFIEKGIYDMIELDIQLEEHGIPCIIT